MLVTQDVINLSHCFIAIVKKVYNSYFLKNISIQ